MVLDVLYPKVAEVRDEVGRPRGHRGQGHRLHAFPVNLLAPRTMKKHALQAGEPWPPVPAGAQVQMVETLMKADLPAGRARCRRRSERRGRPDLHGRDDGAVEGGDAHSPQPGVQRPAGHSPGSRTSSTARRAIMCVIPFFHSYGMTVAMNLGVLLGAKLVLQVQPDIETTLKAIAKEKPTLFPGVPRLYIAINEDPRDAEVRPALGEGLPLGRRPTSQGGGREVRGHHRGQGRGGLRADRDLADHPRQPPRRPAHGRARSGSPSRRPTAGSSASTTGRRRSRTVSAASSSSPAPRS